MALLKENRPPHDFFLADIFDNTPIKDDIASMENPMFILSKKKDMRCLEYKKENVSISIIPSVLGLPNIFDKDILLYCGSLLIAEINKGNIPPRTLRISSHDLLVSTNRRTDGIAYTRLKDALNRLKGVSIKTNIRTNKREITKAFGLIESYEVIESSRIKDRMIRLEITLSEWFYNSILGTEVLTINRDYFRLGKPMERRLYEIARKHCGKQKQWQINLIPLMAKTGSNSPLRMFRFYIKEICTDNHLPDYNIVFNAETDMVTFSQKGNATTEDQPCLPFDEMPHIHPHTIEKAKRITTESGTGWDFQALQEQFTMSIMSGNFKPEKVDGAFINFVKKKTAQKP